MSINKSLHLLSLIISMLLSSVYLIYVSSGDDIKLDELALGRETISVFSKIDDDLIHCKDIAVEVTGGTFDARSKIARASDRPCLPERLRRRDQIVSAGVSGDRRHDVYSDGENDCDIEGGIA